MQPRIVIPENPLARFRSLYQALERDRRWWRDSARLRYAAMAAICTQGDPATIASGIRSMERALKEASPWHMDVGSHIRFIVGAILYQNGDGAKSFINAFVRTRKMFRDEKLRRALAMELLAFLVLRIQAGGGSVTKQKIRRFREIYDEMKQHHKWLTGADDFPACAILSGQDGTPKRIGDRIEQIYTELRCQKFRAGNPLQTAANILFIVDGTPQILAERAGNLRTLFNEHKVRASEKHYDELALLSFLEVPGEKIVGRVLAIREDINNKIRPRFDTVTAFNAAAGIAFVEFGGHEADSVALTNAKSLIDIQAVVAAQQAAIAGAAAASTAA